MELLLMLAVGLLSFANGANDNFKGVATIWGAGRTTYWRALAWATGFTFLGSVVAIWVASGLIVKFSGANLVPREVYTQGAFLGAVALAAAATVLLAARLGLPISTTHALTGSLVGAGAVAAGFGGVQFAALGKGVVLPLLFSPVVSLGLTVMLYPALVRLGVVARERDCVCVDEAPAVVLQPSGATMAATAVPAVRWANSAACETGVEVVHFRPVDALHWLSGAAISFARGLNDTPKIAALLLVVGAGAAKLNFALVGLAMAVGGILGAARVAKTMSKSITPMAPTEAVTANLVAATLVGLASQFSLPVSTTHVTSGSIFGIGLLRRGEADWRRVREILLSWAATLPMGAMLAALAYLILKR